MEIPEKYYIEYYKELGTTQKEYYSYLAGLVIQEKKKKKDKKRIYNMLINIENGKIFIVEMEEGQEDIKEVIYRDRNNFYGLLHASLIAEDLKVKGYIIIEKSEIHKGTFTPYFKLLKHTKKLNRKIFEVLKKRLERKKQNDKDKK